MVSAEEAGKSILVKVNRKVKQLAFSEKIPHLV